MLKKIYQELVLIRKELQTIRSSKEFNSDIIIGGKLDKENKKPTLNDMRKEHGLSPIQDGDVVLTKE